jgi:hypothetical protein
VAAIDLIDVADLKQWATVGAGASAPAGSSIDNLIQDIISGVSQFVYTWTGRVPNTLNTGSTPQSITEVYSGGAGNGPHLYLRSFPIVGIQSLKINGIAIKQSSAYGQPGWFIEDNQKSISIRPGGGAGTFQSVGFSFPSYRFVQGIGNIEITYTAGFDATPDDLAVAVFKMCTVILTRRLREDNAGVAVPGAGTTSYRPWDFPTDAMSILKTYKRISTT